MKTNIMNYNHIDNELNRYDTRKNENDTKNFIILLNETIKIQILIFMTPYFPKKELKCKQYTKLIL